MNLPPFAAAMWRELSEPPDAPTVAFDPATLDGLPEPARRLLEAAIPAGAPLSMLARLEMEGEIKLGGRWFPFTAAEVLRAGTGVVWAPVVGGRLLRFTGADVFGPGDARMEFRLHGRIPIVRESGPDVARSAIGRVAGEAAVWLPQALTPQAGARWEPIDDSSSAVVLVVDGREVRVEVGVDRENRIRSVGLQRWKGDAEPPVEAPFGGSVDRWTTDPNGVRIAAVGTVGWDWGTPGQAEGEFFRYRITSVEFAP
jgi:hypothetical protein